MTLHAKYPAQYLRAKRQGALVAVTVDVWNLMLEMPHAHLAEIALRNEINGTGTFTLPRHGHQQQDIERAASEFWVQQRLLVDAQIMPFSETYPYRLRMKR